MKRSKALLAIALVVCGFQGLDGQTVSAVNMLLVGTEGNETARAKGAEGRLSDFQDYLTTSLGGRSKNVILVPLSKQALSFSTIATAYSTSDSSDILVSLWMGPWLKNEKSPERSELLSNQKVRVQAEYLLNLASFVPSKSLLMFILAPQQFSFPEGVLKNPNSQMTSGGKYVVVVKPPAGMDFDGLADAFADILKNMQKLAPMDVNKDGWVSVSEWLRDFMLKSKAQKLALTMSQVAQFPDFRIAEAKP